MKAIILAAGYGTRLQRDLDALEGKDKELYKNLIGKPKPLIPIGGKPLIEYLIEEMQSANINKEDIYIVSNDMYYNQFKEWAEESDFDLSNIINDGSTSNETRKGAVADIELVIEEKNIDGDLVVVAGDTLFKKDFSLKDLIGYFKEKKRDYESNITIIPVYDETGDISRRGIIELDPKEKDRVAKMLEKPDANDTESRLATIPLYIMGKRSYILIKDFLQEKNMLEEKDAPGKFISWLCDKKPIFVMEVSGRYDIGNMEDYINTEKDFT